MNIHEIPLAEIVSLSELLTSSTVQDKSPGERFGLVTLALIFVNDHCLFTYHDLVLRKPIDLVEFTKDYICLSSMTRSSARFCPIDKDFLIERNTLSFSQSARKECFRLEAGERHRSFTICFLPSFFDRLAGITDAERTCLVDHLTVPQVNTHTAQITEALESMDERWAQQPGGDLFCYGRLQEIIALALCDALAAETPQHQRLPPKNAVSQKKRRL